MRLGEGKAALAARLRVKKEREGNRWTLEQMAERLREEGIEQTRATTVYKIENGDRRISLDELTAFANIFKMGVADLLLDRKAYVEDLFRRFTDEVDSFRLGLNRLMAICAEADEVLGDSHELLVLADRSIDDATRAFDALNERFMAVLGPMLHVEFDDGSLM